MDTTWQVVIGTAIASLLITLYGLYRSYVRESKKHGEKQGLAKISIFLGLSGIILVGVGSLLGITFGFISMRGKHYRALSKLGIVISILTFIPWVLVYFFGQ